MKLDKRLIDFHSHILPCADHGSKNLEMSLRQIERISAADVKTVVATPHFYPDRTNVDKFLEMRRESEYNLREATGSNSPEIVVGAEVLICSGIHKMKGLEKLCIGDTDYILLEMPFYRWGDHLFETVRGIIQLGLKPIMAHIDRYCEKDVERIMCLNVAAQVNTDAINSFFGRKKVMRWIDEGRVVALGSDLHGDGNYADFVRGCTRLGDKCDEIMAMSEMILKNDKYVF